MMYAVSSAEDVERERARAHAARQHAARGSASESGAGGYVPGEKPAAYLARVLPGTAIPQGARHARLWDWFGALTPGVKPKARIEIWPRGGAKSTQAEQGAVYAGMAGLRTFVLYVCGTQVQADMHLSTIAAYLERIGVDRAVNSYGQSKGWSGKLLRAANGFNALSIGLDGNIRGAKLDELRPDLIVLDDVDDRHDSPQTTAKKLRTIFQTILPAGSPDAAIVFIQNKIHKNSCIAQIADGRADALLSRDVTEEPAVWGLSYERRERDDGTYEYAVTGGEPSWPEGQSLETCGAQINEWGPTAFLNEAQHLTDEPDGGMFSHLVYRRIAWAALPPLVRRCVWCDPAVTSTDTSDCNGIQADARGVDGLIYRLWSWEQRATPQETLSRAIIKAIDIDAEVVGVETDQGGDTWASVYQQAVRALSADEANLLPEELTEGVRRFRAMFAAAVAGRAARFRDDGMPDEDAQCAARVLPVFRSAKAGASAMGKAERAAKMLSDYERGRIVHVEGTHHVLEAALRRFPLAKPYDLVDSGYWSWDYLTGGGQSNSAVGAFG